MGGNSSLLKFKSRSTTDVDRIRPSAEQRNPKKKSRFPLPGLTTSKHFSKISFKRKGCNREKVRTFKELIGAWSFHDVEALFREMEALRVLSELSSACDAARPSVSSIGEQLMASSTQNLNLVFKGVTYPVHSRLVRTRSQRVSCLISGDTSVLELTSPLSWLDSADFREFITYLYTDSCGLHTEVLTKLITWFDVRRSLAEDLELLVKSADSEGDLLLILRKEDVHKEGKSSTKDYSIRVDSEIVGCRSDLLASLVKRKQNDMVVIDEKLLPRSFSQLLIHHLYTDQLNFDQIAPTPVSLSSLSEARDIVSGRCPNTPYQKAEQTFHIAKFFGLKRLVQLCEDVIVSSLSLDNSISILRWAEDGGSVYVANMARRFLTLEFSRLSQSHHLFDLSIEHLVHCVSSHFLQASEVEVLEAIIKWGEHELLKRMESREPNIVADTTHSISRRGIRRNEVSDAELKGILEPVSSLIRTDYILPPFHQSLNSAYRRGIIERSPLKDLVICSSTAEINPDLHWFCPDPEASGPRFYLPYFQIVKSHMNRLLEEEKRVPSTSATSEGRGSGTTSSTPPNALKVVITNCEPDLLDEATFNETRQKIVKQIESADKEYGLRFMPRPFHRRLALTLISSRVLRECSIDNSSVEVRLSEWAESQEGSSTSSSVRLHCGSQPVLHWPDIMTLERKKKVKCLDSGQRVKSESNIDVRPCRAFESDA